jgi:hypothetical protein
VRRHGLPAHLPARQGRPRPALRHHAAQGLSEGGELPDHFGRDEVVAILREYYEGLTEKVEIKTHKAATGD